MKARFLTIGVIATFALGGAIGSLHAKSPHLTNITVGKMCPDYNTNPELEAKLAGESTLSRRLCALEGCIEHPRKTDRNVYNHPQWCEKFKIRSDNDFTPLSNSDSIQFRKMRCPLG